ncbi:MAG TPA: penicillin amidase [Myxococcales bacterium]|nr:penicillin amidase [Myxococcales bacterium]|tara:strand:- start:128 stop:2302 length:2175 start_codon:yes stop_codon:yes gene_type:complete
MSLKRIAHAFVVLVVLLVGWYVIRQKLILPGVPSMTKKMLAQAQRVQIIRDKWGVPHVFGKSDADAAFGLAYAHAEDDFKIIQLVLAASTGRLSLLMLNTKAIGNDFYTSLVRVREQVDALYPKLSPKTRALLEGYAQGVNYYVARHPHEADGRLFPISGKHIAMGFVHKVPLMFNLPKVLVALRNATQKKVGQPVFSASLAPTQARQLAQARSMFASTASNAHAVHRARFRDGITRLNVNSHQPWEGPVTWYEAHVHSEEGWDAVGGLFPGAPVILHGHNAHLGWAMTVNKPDLIDVYKLKMHPTQPLMYQLDGQWKKLSHKKADIQIDTGLFTFPFGMDVFYSEHGPVLKTKHGYYAIRYAGIDKAIFSVEQWYKMNKATDFESWKQAMRTHAIPMFNIVYADKDNVFYVYNSLLPKRKQGLNYKHILPGDQSSLIWKQYVPWDALPAVHNPPSGFVQNCNATPFHATAGKGNPLPSAFQKETGIEQKNNNRSTRSLQWLAGRRKLSMKDFLRMKFDLQYASSGPVYKAYIAPVLRSFRPKKRLEKMALSLYRRWDRRMTMNSRAGALFLLTHYAHKKAGLFGGPKAKGALDAFRQAVRFMRKHYGKLVPLGRIQRIRRGAVDRAVSGGYDVLRAVHTRRVGNKFVGRQGDSYILIASFTKNGVRSQSRHQYGNVNRMYSKHYADQVKPFVKMTFKTIHRDRGVLLKEAEAVYHPGQEKGSR